MDTKINSDKPDAVVQAVLRDYTNKDLTTEEIAARHGVCPATITVWVKKAGLPLRTRGRRSLDQPTSKHRKILEMAGHLRLTQVGAKMGMQKQAVHRIVQRWKNWKPSNYPPFVPGDKVLWNGDELVVLQADKTQGILYDPKARRYFKKFTWGGELPKRIGFDDAYRLYSGEQVKRTRKSS